MTYTNKNENLIANYSIIYGFPRLYSPSNLEIRVCQPGTQLKQDTKYNFYSLVNCISTMFHRHRKPKFSHVLWNRGTVMSKSRRLPGFLGTFSILNLSKCLSMTFSSFPVQSSQPSQKIIIKEVKNLEKEQVTWLD